MPTISPILNLQKFVKHQNFSLQNYKLQYNTIIIVLIDKRKVLQYLINSIRSWLCSSHKCSLYSLFNNGSAPVVNGAPPTTTSCFYEWSTVVIIFNGSTAHFFDGGSAHFLGFVNGSSAHFYGFFVTDGSRSSHGTFIDGSSAHKYQTTSSSYSSLWSSAHSFTTFRPSAHKYQTSSSSHSFIGCSTH